MTHDNKSFFCLFFYNLDDYTTKNMRKLGLSIENTWLVKIRENIAEKTRGMPNGLKNEVD